MVESTARKVLKESLKAWIMLTERWQAGLAQLREELDDVVAEARHEYEHRAEGAADERPASAPDADASATKPKVSRSRRPGAGTPRGTKRTNVAV